MIYLQYLGAPRTKRLFYLSRAGPRLDKNTTALSASGRRLKMYYRDKNGNVGRTKEFGVFIVFAAVCIVVATVALVLTVIK